MESVEKALHLLRLKDAGCASAEVDGVGFRRKFGVVRNSECGGSGDVFGEAVDVTVHACGREHSRGKIAITALRPAKWDGDVDPERHGGQSHVFIIGGKSGGKSEASK